MADVFTPGTDERRPRQVAETLPEFTHYGWVAPGHNLARSGEVEPAVDGDRWFRYGVADGALFIEWVTP